MYVFFNSIINLTNNLCFSYWGNIMLVYKGQHSTPIFSFQFHKEQNNSSHMMKFQRKLN